MDKKKTNKNPKDQMTPGKVGKNYNDALIKLATIQPSTKSLDPHPKTLKHFPLRRTAKLFAITDAIMASMLLVARYLITTRIVTFPIFQLAATTFYLLISCFGIFQIFSETIGSFPVFLICYPIAMTLNLISTAILGMQTFDMGLISENCGDVEICVPFVKPIALAGWILVAGSFAFLTMNCLMLRTYWQLSNRIIEEQNCEGYSGQPFMHSHAHHHHQYSHQQYPINYSRSISQNEMEWGGVVQNEKKIRTPQPKRPAKNFFNDPNEIIIITKPEASKLSLSPSAIHSNYLQYDLNSQYSSVVSSDYKSLQISPLDFTYHNQNIH